MQIIFGNDFGARRGASEFVIISDMRNGRNNHSDGGGRSVVSLFSGCGGLDLGFLGGFKTLGKTYKRLPFKIVWANDIDDAACETYRQNISDDIRCGDVWEAMKTLPKRADVVIGGFPCQDVSVNGLGMGANGHRTNLYKAMLESVRRLRPGVFVAENVKGLIMEKHRSFREQIVSDFENLGYTVDCRLYLAADYGVPQMRARVFIVGARDGASFSPPPPVVGKDNWTTAKAAAEDLESLPENKDNNHIWSKARRNTEQGNRILKPGRPADTIRAECHGNSHFHYRLPRRVSMREAARFQSFPDNFIFARGIRKIERQIGNAVPPVLAWHIAKSVAAGMP